MKASGYEKAPLATEKYSRGRRGAPAKGVGRVTGARVQISPSPPYKDTIEIWTLKFGVNGVFIIKPSIYAAFRGRIFFLPAGLKTEKRKFYNPKI